MPPVTGIETGNGPRNEHIEICASTTGSSRQQAVSGLEQRD